MPDSPMRLTRLGGLFSELRRRRVLRSGAIYVAASWVLIQVADTTFPIFDVADVYIRYITIALVAGFPVAIALSWIFDLDPPSLIRTPREDDAPASIAALQAETPAYTISESNVPARSIAVMPFANLGKDPENEFFSDGVAEEMLNLLCKVPDLKVAARTSSFAFRDSNADARHVADRLGVRHVLEGSVRRAAERVRISAQLIDAATGYTLWSSSFDRDLHDIFAVQDEIASCIVLALKEALDDWAFSVDDPPLRTAAPTENIESYQLYLRGMYLWQRRGETAIRGAIGALTRAVDEDPNFADAITLLAISHAALHEYSGEDREAGFAIAQPLALRAMELDPDLGKPHAVLGYMALRRWEWSTANKQFRLALALEDADPMVHLWYSNLLNDLGYQEKALKHALTAYQLDRLSPQANNILALNFLMLGRDEAARKHVAVAREFGLGGPVPDYVEYIVHLRQKEYDKATDLMCASLQRSGADTSWVAPTVAAMASPDALGAAREALAQALGQQHVTMSMAHMQYILLRQNDKTFELADVQLEGHKLTHLWLFLPEAEPLRQDPRFLQLMERMGVVEYWRSNGQPPVITERRGNNAAKAD